MVYVLLVLVLLVLWKAINKLTELKNIADLLVADGDSVTALLTGARDQLAANGKALADALATINQQNDTITRLENAQVDPAVVSELTDLHAKLSALLTPVVPLLAPTA